MDTHGQEKKIQLKIVQYMFKGTGKKCVLYRGLGFPGGANDKEPACQCRRQEMQVQCLGQEDPLEEGMTTSSTLLAWREPVGLQSIELQRVGHD